jgi:hypothetical protein
MYNLTVDGLRDIRRFIEVDKVGRDPLSGILDGSNTLFFTTYSPILSGSTFTLYEGTSEVSSGSYNIDYDTGEVLLDDVPDEQVRATYWLSEFSNAQLTRFLMQAFDDMEARLSRGWRLSSGSVTYAAATEDSSNIYIVAGGSVVDPPCGSTTFNTSWIQRGFYLANIEYTIAMRKLNIAADGFRWREDRGITVDKSRMAAGRALSLEFIEERLRRYRISAADEHYSAAEHYGGYQPSLITKAYAYDYEWQTDSRDEDYRGVYAGNV